MLDIINPFNAPVYYRETTASTMDEVRVLAGNGAPHGTALAAGEQRSGRGRAGRPWVMSRGESLPFTVLLRYRRIEDIPPALTLRAGLALSFAVEDFVPSLAGSILVKWPNDLMIRLENGVKKAAGILAEADGGKVYLGIGINVAQREFPAWLQDKATSLVLASHGKAITGRKMSGKERSGLLEKILARLYTELETERWQERLEERLYKKGEEAVFVPGAADSAGGVEGRIAGIGASGELMLIPKGKTEAQAYITGELQL